MARRRVGGPEVETRDIAGGSRARRSYREWLPRRFGARPRRPTGSRGAEDDSRDDNGQRNSGPARTPDGGHAVATLVAPHHPALTRDCDCSPAAMAVKREKASSQRFWLGD